MLNSGILGTIAVALGTGCVVEQPRVSEIAAAATEIPATCAEAAQHLVTLALDVAPLEQSTLDHADIESACVDGAWTQPFITCLASAPDLWRSVACRSSTMTTQPNDNTDGVVTSCAAVGQALATHLAPLKDLVPAEALAALPGELETSCTANAWPEDLRRRYTSATPVDTLLIVVDVLAQALHGLPV